MATAPFSGEFLLGDEATQMLQGGNISVTVVTEAGPDDPKEMTGISNCHIICEGQYWSLHGIVIGIEKNNALNTYYWKK